MAMFMLYQQRAMFGYDYVILLYRRFLFTCSCNSAFVSVSAMWRPALQVMNIVPDEFLERCRCNIEHKLLQFRIINKEERC